MFYLKNVQQAFRKAQKQFVDQSCFVEGFYVVVTITDQQIIKQVLNRDVKQPLIVSSLYQHERKMNVCHVKAKFQNEFLGTLESKKHYAMHLGFRVVNPSVMFSNIYVNSELLKYTKKITSGQQWHLISFYGQTYFPPQNAIILANDEQGTMKLAMVGSSLFPDPFKVILKRVVLTGYPFKAKGKRAVVRCMFYSPADVKYFQSNEVYTKRGLKGRIQESLGTHGLMKCVFNDVVRQSETVCMNLFKRVFPKYQ